MNRGIPFLTAAAGADADRLAHAAVRMDRACTELRRGRAVVLSDNAIAVNGAVDPPPGAAHAGAPAGGLLLAAVETLGAPLLRRLMSAPEPPRLLLSGERLEALGWPLGSAPRALALPPGITLLQLQQLAAVAPGPADRGLLVDAAEVAAFPAVGSSTAMSTEPSTELSTALTLAKRARLVPALLLSPLSAEACAAQVASHVLPIAAADVALAAPTIAAALRRVSQAQVPITAHESCTLVLFREVDGDAEHVAIVIGRPPAGVPVPVRLHSACLTGDLLGSLRCDCGPQLQHAVARLAESGGVLLYLAQEGRGTGLANKLRAYGLQDGGLDTLEADRHLGFREDERDFSAAAAMLQALGHTRIRLLTNNPQKIQALRDAGIEVVERLPLHGPVNPHNARYMRTKRLAGHLGASGENGDD